MRRIRGIYGAGQAQLRLLLLAVVLFASGGCSIRDKLDGCPEKALLLKLNVVDIGTGKSITTDTARVADATLFVFDKNMQLINTLQVARENLGKEIRVPLGGYEGSAVHVSAWANLSDNVSLRWHVHEGEGAWCLSLLDGEPGYRRCPGEMFFGLHEVELADRQAKVEPQPQEIGITQKNARLMITVRGLPSNARAEDYYFKFSRQNCGYGYFGSPTINSIDIREGGVFNENHELVSPQPYYLIHSVNADSIDEVSGMALHLIRKTAEHEEDIDITGQILRDESGAYIGLAQAKTTNVLVELRSDGDMRVSVEVTAWNELYLWSEWW